MSPILAGFSIAWVLLGIGLYGLIATRHLIGVIIALQMMVKAAMLMLVVAGKLNDQLVLAQSIAITVLVADTIAVVIGLAFTVRLKMQFDTLDIDQIINLEG